MSASDLLKGMGVNPVDPYDISALPWVARYGIGPTESYQLAMSGQIPGTDPQNSDPTNNQRTTSGFLFGNRWPNFGPWVAPALAGLKDPNSGLNRFPIAANGLPGGGVLRVGDLNPFRDPSSDLTKRGTDAIYAGANSAVEGTPPNSGPQPPNSGSQQPPEFGSTVYAGYDSHTPPPQATPANTQRMGPEPGGEDRYPPSMGPPTVPALGDNMPTGQNYSNLIPDPGGDASNNTPASAPYDFGPGTHSGESGAPAPYAPPVTTDPRMNASNPGDNNALGENPALAAIYSNTSGAGGSQLNLNSAMSHPSFSQYYQDYLRSLGA